MFIRVTHFNHVVDHMYHFMMYIDTYVKTILGSSSGRIGLVIVQFSMLQPSLFFLAHVLRVW